MQVFKLTPFPSNTIPNMKISGGIVRAENNLFIRYEVNGDIDKILLSTKATSPSRTDDLWKATCFEFFAAIPNQPGYWEFNMSPSSDWNVYRMDAYRRFGFREETAFTQLPFLFKETENQLSLDISVNLDRMLQPEQSVQVGIATIIQTMDRRETYWALTHPGQQADFQLREGFILEL